VQNSETARRSWTDGVQILFESLTLGSERKGVDLAERGIFAFEDLFWKPEHRQRPWHSLMAALKEWSRERPQVVLSFRSEQARKKFIGLAGQDGLVPATSYVPGNRGLFAVVSPLRHGAELSWCGALVLPEDALQPAAAGHRATVRDTAFKGLRAAEELSPGDLIVHRDWGLGRFGGLTRLTVGKATNDYLLLEYRGDDRLYLPVDRLGLVQRWKGPEGVAPVLDKLGGAGWSKTKAGVRKAVEKVAGELVEMYAFRKVAKGYAVSPPNELYWELEASFGFEETPDQERAIADVFRDMESPAPMDRLVCGDVGFGKTEVALRAAFRAAVDGRQVALLCPTTVLAEQHYQTFLRRLKDFPVNVAMLSRFVPAQRQKAVLAAAARGQVDILIGTHRLLSKDVILPRLGLLVLDEEQRFGVKHKERLKELRKSIDVLTLTATPIPRTLQLSLAGVRSLSVIETPPEERKPVATALIERDGRRISAEPHHGFRVLYGIDFGHPLIGRQEMEFELAPESFLRRVAKARTFGFLKDVERLQRAGLALGGSLDNAVVLDEYGVVNPEGLRFKDEFVRHKVLDFIGDMAVAPLPLLGSFEVRCAGHAMHNELLRLLTSQPETYLEVVEEALPGLAPEALPEAEGAGFPVPA